MGLKMNGLNGTGAVMNGAGNAAQMNGHKMKPDKKQIAASTAPTLGQNFMNQSLMENFIKSGGGVLPNSNLLFPMVPNLHENYNVMNAALLASFSNPLYPMNLNPYHIQNLLKLSGVPHLASAAAAAASMDDESQSKSLEDDDQKIARPRQIFTGKRQRDYVAIDKRS